jgi:hypothetical protein
MFLLLVTRLGGRAVLLCHLFCFITYHTISCMATSVHLGADGRIMWLVGWFIPGAVCDDLS